MPNVPDPQTAQDIVDTVWARLIEQGGPGWDPASGGCRYYLPETGRACAVGVLLTDAEKGAFGRERVGISSFVKLVPRLEPHFKVLLALQDAHDTAAYNMARGASSWPEALRAQLVHEFDRVRPELGIDLSACTVPAPEPEAAP